MKQNNTYKPIVDIRPPAKKKKGLASYVSIFNNRLAIIAVVLVVAITGGYLYHRHQQSTAKPSGQSQINSTVEKVGKLYLLPTGEQPTLAIINDVSKYANVAFFKNAANGDQLLVYAQAREAILYRPSINKIISVAPLSSSSQSSSTTNQ